MIDSHDPVFPQPKSDFPINVPSGRNLTEGGSPLEVPEEGGMRIADRYDLARDLRSRYGDAGRVERGAILDAFCMTTGVPRLPSCEGSRNA